MIEKPNKIYLPEPKPNLWQRIKMWWRMRKAKKTDNFIYPLW